MASNEEEDAPTLVNNLIPRPSSKENKDTNKMKESKTAEDKRDRIEIKDKEDELRVRLGFRLFLLERTL